MRNLITRILMGIPDSPPAWFGVMWTMLTVFFVIVLLIAELIT